MANKFTITVNATVTSQEEQDKVYSQVYAAMQAIGTKTLINQMNINQWVDDVNSKPQVFNDDGTPYVESETITEDTSATA